MSVFEFYFLKLLFKVNERSRVLSLGLCFIFDSFDFIRKASSKFDKHMLVDSIQDFIDEFFAFRAEIIVELVALNQEHVHSNFEWHLISDSLDGLMILVDLSLELISIERFLLQEFIDPLLLIENENEIIVDVQCFIHYSQVLLNGLRNSRLGLIDNLIIGWNIPKMLLVTALNGVLWSRQVSTLVNDMINNDLQLVLHIR